MYVTNPANDSKINVDFVHMYGNTEIYISYIRTLIQYLNENNIGTRLLFGGNVIKQPYMKEVEYRVGSKLENTEIVMSNTFWIGLFPGLTNKHLEHSSDKIISFFKNK